MNRSSKNRSESKAHRDRSRGRSPRRREDARKIVVNTISKGFKGSGLSHSALRRHLKAIKSIHVINRSRQRDMLDITFTNQDFRGIDTRQDDPMMITVDVVNCEIREMLVDQESSVDVLYWKTFKRMGLDESEIILLDEQIVGFSGECGY